MYGLTNLANDIIYKFEYVIFKEVLLLKTESERLIGRFALWNKHVCFASCFVGGFFQVHVPKLMVYAQVHEYIRNLNNL